MKSFFFVGKLGWSLYSLSGGQFKRGQGGKFVRKFTLILLVIRIFLPELIFTRENNYSIEYLTIDEGLPDNQVISILCNSNGLMWFGTQSGLFRYDGYEFLKFAPKPSELKSINSPTIERIYADSRKNIWIGTKSGGLNKLNLIDESYKIYPYCLNDSNCVCDQRIISLCEDNEDYLWIGTWENGINKYNYQTETFKQYLPGNNISKIIKTRDNTIWAAGYYGFWRYNRNQDRFIRIDMEIYLYDNYLGFVSLAEDSIRNKLWIGGWEQGVIEYDIENNTFIKPLDFTESKNLHADADVYTIHVDREGIIWIGTWGNGLWKYYPENKKLVKVNLLSPYKKSHFKRDVILDIFEDNFNNIWIATNNAGIIKLAKKQAFQNIHFENEDAKYVVFSVFQDKNENLFMGTQNEGLFWKEKYKSIKPVLTGDNSEVAETNLIYKRKNGKIWVGGNEFIYEVNWDKGTPILNNCSEIYSNAQLNIVKVLSILEVNNKLYIGSKQNSLYLFQTTREDSIKFVRQFIPKQGEHGFLQNERISYLLKDFKNRIWVGTFGGLHILENDTIFLSSASFIKDQKRLTCDIINCIYEDSKGRIWVGTPCGINVLTETDKNNFQLTTYTKNNVLVEDNIYGILEDENENIWISSNNSITRIKLENNAFISFFRSDGLDQLNFYTAHHKTSKGELIFGGTGGVVKFKPEEIKENKNIPQIAITSFSILNVPVEIGKKYNGRNILTKSINETEQLTLSHKENEFSFEVSALDYNAPDKNQYAYKLLGYNDQWIYIGNRRLISFSNLSHGNYIFKIKGSNNNGYWNEVGKSIEIVILAPWWQTWLAYTILVLLFLTILYIIRWTSMKQIILQRNVEMLQFRNQQEKAMNEMKLRFFTNISHEFKTPLTLIIGPISEILNKIRIHNLPDDIIQKTQLVYKNARRLMKLASQLLEFRKAEMGKMQLKAENLNINEFIEEIYLSFEELARLNKVCFIRDHKIKDVQIWFDRDKLEIILNNLISNSFKYIQKNGEIRIVVDQDDQYINIRVIDNGIGIAQADIKNIFERFYQIESEKNYGSSGIGLALAKRYVEMHKGLLKVNSEPNVKTEFIVSLLKGNNHLSASEMIEDHSVENLPIIKAPEYIADFSQDRSFRFNKRKKSFHSDITILIVEDNEELGNYLKDLLSPYYNIENASDGAEGFEKAINLSPKLIISDVMMPKIDGFELCQKIRNHMQLKHIPIVLLTAKPPEQYEVLGLRVGADEYISKPFDPELLKEKIIALLKSRNLLEDHFSKTVRIEGTQIEIAPFEKKLIDKSIQIIEDNLLNPEFNAEFLAQGLKLSHSSLYRKLKAISGYSINAFIRKIRLDKANQLLSDKEKTISEIAFEVGFNDLKYFRDCFVKQFGTTPQNYRNSL